MAAMTREQFDSAVRAAATYHADEGTSGWLLSEGQFAAILTAADEYRAQAVRELAAEFDDIGLSIPAAIAREKAEAHGSAL